MKDLKVIFMGTPEYSLPVLEMLYKNTNLIGVVTQPDKKVGRKKVLTPCPCKKYALDNNIKVLTPFNIKEEYQEIIDLKPDIIITCAYGQMIPEKLIEFPKYKIVNVHASLLPKYRGGAPINRAIMNGEKETGVTIMFTDKGMDSGDIIKEESIKIDIDDTYDQVSERLSFLGAKLLKEVLPTILDGSLKRIKQNDSDKTLAPIIKREDEHISFNDTSLNVHNKIRGLSSIPTGYAILDNQNIKIYKSTIKDCNNTDKEFGTITRVDKEGIFVSCQDKEIKLLEIQVPGKKKVLVKDYLNGKKDLEGKRFS